MLHKETDAMRKIEKKIVCVCVAHGIKHGDRLMDSFQEKKI